MTYQWDHKVQKIFDKKYRTLLMTAYYLNAKQHSIVGAHKAGPRQIQAIVKFLPKAY